MKKSLVMQGRPIGSVELEQARGLLAAHPDRSRYRLARDLYRVWSWRNLTGQIKDTMARRLLLKLERPGWVAGRALPPFAQTHAPEKNPASPAPDRSIRQLMRL